jgi:hypothetical protein
LIERWIDGTPRVLTTHPTFTIFKEKKELVVKSGVPLFERSVTIIDLPRFAGGSRSAFFSFA